MLRLICGVSGTGKTTLILNEIKERALAGKSSILLVPEQFSSSAETGVFAVLGDRLSSFAGVFSFTSYAERLLKIYGGTAIPTLTDAGRVVLVRRALEALGDEIKTYRRHRRSTGFCMMCADAITELKSAGATCEKLLEVSKTLGGDGEKLYELSLIYAAYEALLKGAAMDPTDRLSLAAEKLPDGTLDDIAVYIDNFDGFIAPQYELLQKLICAKSCAVALCCDDTQTGAEYDLFSPIRKTARNLKRLAARAGEKIAPEIHLEKNLRQAETPSLCAVNELAAFDETDIDDGSAVFLTEADDVYSQIKAVACQIARLGRSGVRYSDIAVICREADAYEAAVRYEFGLFDIPYFSDQTTTLEHTAPAAFYRAALSLASHGISTEGVLRLLKTDLCCADQQSQADLENYAYTWQPTAKDWRAPFTKNPSGFGSEMTAEDKRVLQSAEALRARVIPLCESFIYNTKNALADEISRQLYLLLTHLGGENAVKATAEQLEADCEPERADAVYDTWNKCSALLSQMPRLLEGQQITATDYDDLLVLLLRSSDIGHVPQTQNSVMFTTADRMRLNEPKYCFVIGVNEGEFPKAAGSSGLLTHADRDLLVQNDIQMPGSFENRTLLEQMFFYRAVTSPSKALYVSCKKDTLSSAFAVIKDALNPQPLRFTPAEKAATPAAALDLLGESYREDNAETSSLEAALKAHGTAADSLNIMRAAAEERRFKAVDTKAVEALIGSEMNISPTRIEQYYRCRFGYFLQYVLGIRPRKRAELSPLESGTLVHYILENALKTAGEDFVNLTEDEIRELASDIADAYVAENMPTAGARFAYLISRLKEGTTALLQYLQAEQRQSSFHPAAFEQEIGKDGIKPLCVETPDGHKVKIVGKIDRVDTMTREGKTYIRVIDYKSAGKTFSLDDVFCGLNTQMLFYLFTLTQNATEIYPNPVAAGVLYIEGDPSPKAVARDEAKPTLAYSVDGILLDDKLVIDSMDKAHTGLFVPLSFTKSGVRASAKLASLEKLGNIEQHLESLAIEMAKGIYSGDIGAASLCSGVHNPCEVCDYRCVCCHEDGKNEFKVTAPKNVFEPEANE